MKERVLRVFVILLIYGISSLGLAQDARSPLLQSWDQYLELKENSQFRLKWIQLGPVMNSARVEAVQCDPSHPGTWYVAFGSGNLWKTVNHGLSWKPIFENQSALGIGDIALAPSNFDVIWLGTGESLKKARNFTMPGTGVFLSQDGGQTWKNTGLPDSYHIGEIAVHPKDPDTAFVAVQGHFWSANPNRGLYRTTNGGSIWEHVLYVNDRTGANDVVISPSNPEIVYVSLWENNPGISGEESGVYRSKDGGKSWVRLPNGFPQGPKTGRIGLAVSWSDPNKVYALVDNLSKDRDTAAEVYRTLNGGESWQRTHKEELYIFPGIGWYFTDCYVNPKNDDEIYALGVRMARSRDGGKSFKLVAGDVYHLFPNPADPLHLDHCELWINPENPQNLALGNDGGLYVSYDTGSSWMHYNNLPAGEFYDISVDNQDPYMVYGGTQDDSSVYGPSREWKPKYPDGWKYVWLDAWSGGDGCVTIPDPVDPNTVYFSSQNGAINRKDMRADRSQGIRPRLPKDHPGELRYTFITPYFISPHNHLTLYHGGNYIFKTLNQGDTWHLISPDLTESEFSNKRGGAMGAIAESPLKPGLLYAGTENGAFWISQNDGVQWTEISQGLPDRYIRSICPSRFKTSRVYVAVSGINSDDLRNYLFVSEDFGNNWQSLSANLPDEVAYVILEDPTNENILYAGLYRGVYISTDRGQSWSLLGPDLAAMAISDLVIQEREMDLVVGTHGRGIYRMNLRPIQQAFQDGASEKSMLFVPDEARLPWNNDTHRDPNYSTMERVPITIFLSKASSVTLTLKDSRGQSVWIRELNGQKGFNQFLWDLILKRVDSPQAYFYRYFSFAQAGDYTVHVTGEGVDLTGELSIVERANR